MNRPIMIAMSLALAATGGAQAQVARAPSAAEPRAPDGRRYLSQPLVREIYTADPSAHVFDGKIYVYPSHDIDAGIPDDDLGNQYAMRDYRVLRMDRVGAPVTIGPVALDVRQVPWASQQMWAPDAAKKGDTYYLYFPARDRTKDKNGLGKFDPNGSDDDLRQNDRPALSGKVARLNPDMKTLAEAPLDATIVDEAGKPILGGDHDRRFFEASWVFKRGGRYYYTYSTGDTHFLNYAIGDNPYGPFTYKGHILKPVQGWTSHHSIIEHGGKWWLFYADTQLSGKNHLRSAKVTELRFNPDGTIPTIDPFVG